MPNTGGFEDVELDNNEGSNNDSQADHKLKRVRFGTRRNKSGRIDINRSKTLKWAKKNFHNAIDEFSTKEDSLENSACKIGLMSFASVPLIVIVIITAIKDGIEDSRRTVLDLEVNNTRTHILSGVKNENVAVDNNVADFGRPSLDYENLNQTMSQANRYNDGENLVDRTLQPNPECRFAKDYWKNVKVGDIVRVHNNDEIPADMILLSTSDVDGACYVETKNLDGETNLKVRQSLKCSKIIKSSRDITRTKFWVESEGHMPTCILIKAIFIYTDVLLYNAKLDYPCTPKSWNISDDLGQIEYIFSDKTGTLTQNVMEFKKCTINGVSYGRAYTEALAGLRKRQGVDVESEGRREKEEIAKDRETMIDELRSMSDNTQFCPEDLTFVSKEIVEDLKGSSGDHQQKCCEHFLLALALCHSVLVEPNKDDPKKLDIKAQSPDESALVSTARQLGYSFVGSSKSGLIVEIQGVQKEFQVLNIALKTTLLCWKDGPPFGRVCHRRFKNLCLAQRELTWSEYERWVKTYDVAAASVTNREEELDKVTDVIERELILLGGTAIEDRLQDGVPDSIALLAEAGIKLWVLTGDKVETAINIGFSCNVLNNDMELLVVKASGEDVEEFGSDPIQVVNNLVTKYLREKFGMSGSEEELKEAKREHGLPQGNFAVIIDGDALKVALNGEEMRRKFLLLCKNCKAVLCCRVSPAQKAAVVKLVKKTLDVMTLAIGDGSNDVAMIQSADVGVGIAGEEGRQAVMCSDYAIGQFRYVTRLVLVHGKWCYKRLAEMIPQFFYKNVIFTLSLFCVLDQDVSDTVSMLVPQLYRVGILRKEWNQTKFLWYMLDGVYQSVICFFFPYLAYHKNMVVTENGLGLDHRYFVGVFVTAIAVTSCNFYVFMEQYRWDWFCGLFICLSLAVFYGWTGIWTSSSSSNEFYKGAARVFAQPAYWAVLFVGVLFCLLPRFTIDCIRKIFYPKDIEIVREMWLRGDFDLYPQGYDPTDPSRPRINEIRPLTDFKEPISLDTHFDGVSHSQETIVTEEIPMSILNGEQGSRKGTVSLPLWNAVTSSAPLQQRTTCLEDQWPVPAEITQNFAGSHKRRDACQPPTGHKILRGKSTCLAGSAGYQSCRDAAQPAQQGPLMITIFFFLCTMYTNVI
ncbi:phospholipid-translocating P-type ATPase, flippase family protein [Saccharomyces cerevisiae]|nr:phospholipid-translocating P-type ATPase, flippase family protein [Saccharomyces cerevisiae]